MRWMAWWAISVRPDVCRITVPAPRKRRPSVERRNLNLTAMFESASLSFSVKR